MEGKAKRHDATVARRFKIRFGPLLAGCNTAKVILPGDLAATVANWSAVAYMGDRARGAARPFYQSDAAA